MIPLFPIMISLASIMIPLAWCRPWPGVPTDLSSKAAALFSRLADWFIRH